MPSAPSSSWPFAFRDTPLYRAGIDCLHGWNYSEQAIREDYSITVPSHRGSPYLRQPIDAVAFCETRVFQAPAAGITLFAPTADGLTAARDAVAMLSLTHAPVHLLANVKNQNYSFWVTGFDRNGCVQPRPLREGITPERLSEDLAEFAADLRPEIIAQVKRGLRRFQHDALAAINPLQLSLFAEQATGPLLVEHFAHALTQLESTIVDGNRAELGTLAVQLVAARVLMDTGVLNDCPKVIDIARQAETKEGFKNYFQATLLSKYPEAAQSAYDLLKNISFAAFTPELLRDFYRRAYPPEVVKKRGRYDTPLFLTRRIWENIPVEFLPPEARVALDMTCGWGSFLIAGRERLSTLNDMISTQVHRGLVGNDRDKMTADFAALALLTSSGTDSWKVHDSDALAQPDWLRNFRPAIIVGNPPFGGNRTRPAAADTSTSPMDEDTTEVEEQESAEEQVKREEMANPFLDRALDLLAPGGFLAMIMPASFLASEAGPEVRAKLLTHCDITEIWQVPGKFFQATVRPVVIFARKHKNGGPDPETRDGCVRIRNLQPQKACQIGFIEKGLFSRSSLLGGQARWLTQAKPRVSKTKKLRQTNVNAIKYSVVLDEDEWKTIEKQCAPLKQFAHVFQGAVVGKPARQQRPSEPHSYQAKFFKNPKQTLRHDFSLSYGLADTICYPDDLEWPRWEDRARFLAEKVVIAFRDPTWGKRIKVAIDRGGFIFSNSFFIVSPQQAAKGYEVEVLAAILRSKVGNAWLLERAHYLQVGLLQIQDLPCPHSLTIDERRILIDCIQALETQPTNREVVAANDQQIDAVLRAAYGLDASPAMDALWARLERLYCWDVVAKKAGPASPVPSFDQPPSDVQERPWTISGVVEQVCPRQHTITLWLEGFAELQTVPIHDAMPGWLLRPGVAFQTKVSRVEVRQQTLRHDVWGRTTPQVFTYLSEEEIRDALGQNPPPVQPEIVA